VFDCGADGILVLFSGVLFVHTPVRLQGDPAHPRALHHRPDDAHSRGAALKRRAAHPGPVRKLRDPACAW
jgi:hypothetical protein